MNTKARRVKPSKKMIRESISMGMLAIPGIIYLLIFNYIPILGVVIAFKNFKPLKGIMGSDWCGLDNFKYFFASNDALVTIRNTVLYNVAWLILGTICSVGLALMFYSIKNGKVNKYINFGKEFELSFCSIKNLYSSSSKRLLFPYKLYSHASHPKNTFSAPISFNFIAYFIIRIG